MKFVLTAVSSAVVMCTGQPALAQPAAGDTSMAPSYGAPSAAGYRSERGGGRPMTLADFQARYRDRLMRADTDHDGRISQAEFMAAHQPGGQGRGNPIHQFEMLDSNHDGYVTPPEIDAVSAARFARMDANHDGVVTPEERMATRGGGPGGEGGGTIQPLPPQD